MINFSRRAIRYFIYIGVGVFGIVYELLESESVRWPLLAGYAFVISVCLYILAARFHDSPEEEQTGD